MTPPIEPVQPSQFLESGDQNISEPIQDTSTSTVSHDVIGNNGDINYGMWSRVKSFCANIKSEGSQLRWRVALMAGFIGFGTFYQMDIPGAIGMEDSPNTIQKHFVAAFPDKKNPYTNEMNQLLYSVLFYPNIILPLITGVLIDRVIGPHASVLLFTGINFVGTTIFAIGIATANFPAMVTGRLLAGCSQETIFVIRAFFVMRYFKASDGIKGISLAFGTSICVTRIGSLITFPVTTSIADSMGVTAAGFAGSVATFFSFLVAVVLVLVDRHAVNNKIINPIHHRDAKRLSEAASPNRKSPKVETLPEARRKKICGCIPHFENPFTLHQFTSLSLCFWMVCCTYNFFLPPVFAFMGYAKSFFERKSGLSSGEAVLAVSGYNLMSCFSSLFCGVLIDTLGRNSMFLLFATGLPVLLHILLTTTMIHPMILMMIYGANHGLFMSSLLPCIPLVVHEASSALGMGVVGVGNNLYMGIVPLIIGKILDSNTQIVYPNGKPAPTASKNGPVTSFLQTTLVGFDTVQYCMIGITVVCFTSGILLFISDKWRNKGVCSSAPKDRKRICMEIARALESPDAV